MEQASEEIFNQQIFTKDSKKIYFSLFISIILIFIFVITPLNQIFFLCLIMKFIIIAILSYTVYLNINQINILNTVKTNINDVPTISEINKTVWYNYVFTIAIIILIFFIIKSIF
jgi:glucan phosphoethanolaminetransferase (alkaline phosphatase superfamily)